MSEEGLNEEQVLRVAKHFLLSSPPGEFEDVLADVRELIGNDELLNKGAFEIFRTYNVEQLIPVEVPDQKYKVILCKYSEIDETHYLDPHSDKILVVNHTKGIVEDVEDNENEMSETVKDRVSAIQKGVDKYIEEHYINGLCTVYPSQNDPENEIIVCVTASKFNPKNFWSGRWRSVYRVTINKDDNKAKISGSMKVNVHYYENGNVQLNTSKEYGDTIDGSDDSKLAEGIGKLMKKCEGVFQQNIDSTCLGLSNTFKTLRKRLPYTKTLFNFKVGTQKITNEMGGK